MKMSRRKVMQISGATLAGMSVGRLASASGSDMGVARVKAHGVTAASGNHDTLSRQLARFVVKTRFDDLPDHIVDAWKTVVLDPMAIGFVGSTDRLARALGAFARRLGRTSDCTVMNSQRLPKKRVRLR